MKTIIIIMITLLQLNIAYANQLTPIKKGQTAAYDGFLADKDQMKHFRLINEQKKLSEAHNLLLSDLRVTQDSLIAFHKKRAQEANNALIWQETKGYLTNILFFTLGIITATTIAKNVK